MQMSELSRRAGGLGAGVGSWSAGDARADALARIEELHRERVGLGEWGASSASSAGTTSTVGQQQQQQQQQQNQKQQQRRRTTMPEPMGPPPPPTNASSPSSYSGWPPSSLPMSASGGNGSGAVPEASSHEGLQVYTVGHLMPRDMDPAFSGKAAGDGSWAFDAGGMLGAPQQQRQRQQEEGEYMPTNGEEEVVRPSPQNPSSSSSSSGSASISASSSSSSQRTLRVRRSTFVPGWAVPPRVLLVDDDAVTRTLSKKFLQVFGCTTDIAVDGVGAVTKMNLEKYDLVLMVGVFSFPLFLPSLWLLPSNLPVLLTPSFLGIVAALLPSLLTADAFLFMKDIVMPKLDGVAATSLIRKFDQGTPIISMTSNSKPNEIMTYYNHGMFFFS